MSSKIFKKGKRDTKIDLNLEWLSEILYSSFQLLKLSEENLDLIKESDVFTKSSILCFRDSYGNSVLHYIISSSFNSVTKLHTIKTYFTPEDLLYQNDDGISILDLSVIQYEAILLDYILSETVNIIRKDQLLKAFKLLLLFDHFSKYNTYTELYKIFSIYYSKYYSDLSFLAKKVALHSTDTESLEDLSYLLLDGNKCTQVARALGVCIIRTKNKRDFLHSCILKFLDKRIPQICECMLEFIHGSQCVKTAAIMIDGYLTGRGPCSPIRSQLSFYCDWYLTTLCILLERGLFSKSELLVLKSLFSFVYSLSLWFICYSKSNTEDLSQVKLSLWNFVDKTTTLSTAIDNTIIPFKRYFTPINIFCLIKDRLVYNIDSNIDLEFIQFLIECGFSITERDMFGSFPLHHLLHTKYNEKAKKQIIECLIQHGGYPLSVDCSTKSNAFELASANIRDVIESCYPKPYPLKSIVAQYLCSNATRIPLHSIPPDLYTFVMRHSSDVPFLRVNRFLDYSVTFELNNKDSDITISPELFNF
ncbi:hypothetical protein LOD99_1735 [Oopsacas minuta]|uniref:SOCS box domain-containing protein n=1 Tax=Oopsacas minuta TaxID=111878 RepID=A0AAV7K4A8_9METZ|nr:hypothetical protein LOD99_1735 [Oopsacas minuta]